MIYRLHRPLINGRLGFVPVVLSMAHMKPACKRSWMMSGCWVMAVIHEKEQDTIETRLRRSDRRDD